MGKRKWARGAAVIEYALVAMTMMAGTAAAKHLVGASGGGKIADAVAVLDDAAGFGGSFAGGDANSDGRRGSGGSVDDSGGVTGGGGSDAARAKRRNPRVQGTEPRAIVTLNDDGRSAP